MFFNKQQNVCCDHLRVNTRTVRPLADLIYVLPAPKSDLQFLFHAVLYCWIYVFSRDSTKRGKKTATNTKTPLLLTLPSCTHPIDSFPFPAKELGPRDAVISKPRMFSHKTFAFVLGKMCQMSLQHKRPACTRAHSVHQLVWGDAMSANVFNATHAGTLSAERAKAETAGDAHARGWKLPSEVFSVPCSTYKK